MAKADRLVTIEDGRIGQLGVRSERGWVVVRPGRPAAEEPAEPAEASTTGRGTI
jgi:hypothetical protein